jgi:DNA-binding PadR family transcriptional regulator
LCIIHIHIKLEDPHSMADPDSQGPDPSQHLPLKTHWFHILTALSEDPLHGSGIVRSVLNQTNGGLRLWPATLYGSLEDLANLGWIEELTELTGLPEGESRRKRIYRLTPAGENILAAEAGRVGQLAQTVLDRLTSRVVP